MSVTPWRYVFYIYLRFALNENSASGMWLPQKSVHSFPSSRYMVLGWRWRIWMWSNFFFFFAHKKYSRSFVKLQLNPWCHMDYFIDLLAKFVLILICVLKMNGSYGFGTTHGWVINDRLFIFGWTIPLKPDLTVILESHHISWLRACIWSPLWIDENTMWNGRLQS